MTFDNGAGSAEMVIVAGAGLAELDASLVGSSTELRGGLADMGMGMVGRFGGWHGFHLP